MIRFRQFLERKLPKSLTLLKVSLDQYSASQGYEGHPKLTKTEHKFWNKYITTLSDYVTDFIKAPFLTKNRDKIPAKYRKTPSELYRGLVVDKKIFKKFLKNGISRQAEESWSVSKKIGKDFAINNEDRDRTQDYAIMITMKIPKKFITLNVGEFVKAREIIEIAATIENEKFVKMAEHLTGFEHEILVAGKEMEPIKLSDKTMTFWWLGEKEWEKLKLKDMVE